MLILNKKKNIILTQCFSIYTQPDLIKNMRNSQVFFKRVRLKIERRAKTNERKLGTS